MLTHLTTGIATVALLFAAPELRAQHGPPTRVPATVVLADEAVQAEPFVIHTRALGATDVIVLRSDATAAQLSDAVRALVTIRQVGGDTAAAPRIMRMRPQQRGAPSRATLPWIGRVFSDVHAAQLREVPGFGRVRAVQIWLPRQRGDRPERA